MYAVKKLRVSLEQETEATFNAFADGKQKDVGIIRSNHLN